MNKHLLKLIVLNLILITVLSSCQKEKVCGVNNPKKDLPWLKEFIEGFERGHARIYQCTYRDGTVF